MFSLAAQALRRVWPNRNVRGFVGINGGHPNLFGVTVMDLFRLASYDTGLMPGISDRGWFGAESGQVNAFLAAFSMPGPGGTGPHRPRYP